MFVPCMLANRMSYSLPLILHHHSLLITSRSAMSSEGVHSWYHTCKPSDTHPYISNCSVSCGHSPPPFTLVLATVRRSYYIQVSRSCVRRPSTTSPYTYYFTFTHFMRRSSYHVPYTSRGQSVPYIECYGRVRKEERK